MCRLIVGIIVLQIFSFFVDKKELASEEKVQIF